MNEQIEIRTSPHQPLWVDIKNQVPVLLNLKFTKAQAALAADFLSGVKITDAKSVDMWDWAVVSTVLLSTGFVVDGTHQNSKISPELICSFTFDRTKVYNSLRPKFWDKATVAIAISLLSVIITINWKLVMSFFPM